MRLVAKHTQVGYLVPGDRPGCRNCKHFEQVKHDSPVIGPRQACTKHDIEVTSGGICNDYKPNGTVRLDGRPVQAERAAPQVGESFKLVDTREFPPVGEMYEGKPMTRARHARLSVEQLITNEEASGIPELVAIAAKRRRWAGMEKRA